MWSIVTQGFIKGQYQWIIFLWWGTTLLHTLTIRAILISTIPPDLCYGLWFTFLAGGKWDVQELLLDLPTIMAGQVICVQNLPVVRWILTNYSIRDWGNNYRVGLGSYETEVRKMVSLKSQSKYFRFCRLCGIYCNYSKVLWEHKSRHRH